MLELSSNTIKVLGIFGRLAKEQEAFLDGLEEKYSQKPDQDKGYDVFRHLTLTFIPDAKIGDVRSQLDLLKDLKQFLPLKIKLKKPFVKDEESMEGAEHIAVEFELEQTKEIVDFVKDHVGENAVTTWYTKIVWFVPKENQQAVIDALSDFNEMVFDDFYLVSNKQSDDNTIYTTNQFTA
jgi:hypothetical protein